MKRSAHRKWLLIAGTLAIFFSVGAVAWAATGDDAAGGAERQGPAGLRAMGMVEPGDCEGTPADCEDRRQALEERRQPRRDRQEALLDALRADMTPEDQAAYDALAAEIDQKRAALQEARQDLMATLREFRELTDKYLDLDDGSGSD